MRGIPSSGASAPWPFWTRSARPAATRAGAPLRDTAATSGRDTPAVRWAYSDGEYLAMIEECQAAIRRGDAYQLCLTNEASVDVHPDPLAVYLALRASSPTQHGGVHPDRRDARC